MVTTDGSISDIPREEYEEAEERVIRELQEINKPFIVLLNSIAPNLSETHELVSLSKKYGVTVVPVSGCSWMKSRSSGSSPAYCLSSQ